MNPFDRPKRKTRQKRVDWSEEKQKEYEIQNCNRCNWLKYKKIPRINNADYYYCGLRENEIYNIAGKCILTPPVYRNKKTDEQADVLYDIIEVPNG
jgi:hypothetical protein